MKSVILAAILSLTVLGVARGQQLADKAIDVSVVDPIFGRDAGPTVAIDGAHHNFHTVDGRYAPFAALLRNDGFRVQGSTAQFTANELAHENILVISNALNSVNVDNWVPPTPSAFTEEEIAAVKTWVNDGGALLLIADHFPFPGGAMDLAHAFGFEFINGLAVRVSVLKPDTFTTAEGNLGNDAVTRGRNAEETVSEVETFGGSAFRAPDAARPLLILGNSSIVFSSPRAIAMTSFAQMAAQSESVPGSGLLQGAVMKVGKGRIAVFGEAGMFSAQLLQPQGRPFGFNVAPANKQFILNVVHWLSGTLPD